MQCGAVCCSVLQCVAVCLSVSQCVSVCLSVLQCTATHFETLFPGVLPLLHEIAHELHSVQRELRHLL